MFENRAILEYKLIYQRESFLKEKSEKKNVYSKNVLEN
jgi:hypothetical protein